MRRRVISERPYRVTAAFLTSYRMNGIVAHQPCRIISPKEKLMGAGEEA